MEERVFLPIGTVVIVKGEARRKVVVVTRGLAVNVGGEKVYFDYGGLFYPVGMMGDQMLYFNECDIAEVLFRGYSDEEDVAIQKEINKWLIEHDMKQGSVEEINEIRKRQLKEAADRARNMPMPSDILKKDKDNNN